MRKRGGTKRRRTEGLPPVRRNYIKILLQKVDAIQYGESLKGGLSPLEQKTRNKALIALLFLSARRISEVVGRKYEYPDGHLDIWEGLRVTDFRITTLEDKPILRVRFRVLKRGKAKSELKTVMAFVDLRLNDPFCRHITAWLNHLGTEHQRRVFEISRSRAWQIMTELDRNIWNHWFRHQRLTQLSDTMDAFELKEFGKFARLDTALQYVHKAPTKILAKTEEADRLWE